MVTISFWYLSITALVSLFNKRGGNTICLFESCGWLEWNQLPTLGTKQNTNKNEIWLQKKEHLHLFFNILCLIILLHIFLLSESRVFFCITMKIFQSKSVQSMMFHVIFIWNTPIAWKFLSCRTTYGIISIPDYMISIFNSCCSYIMVQ